MEPQETLLRTDMVGEKQISMVIRSLVNNLYFFILLFCITKTIDSYLGMTINCVLKPNTTWYKSIGETNKEKGG